MVKPRLIGVITNQETGTFQSLVIEGVRYIAEKAGFKIQVESLWDERQIAHPPTMDVTRLHGLIAIANAAPDAYLRAAHAEDVPVTLVSHHTTDVMFPSVRFDNASGVQVLVRRMLNYQRQKFLFVRGIRDQVDGREREAAFRAEVRRYALPHEQISYLDGEFDPDTAVAALDARWGRDLTPSTVNAVIAADYLMAIAIADTLRAQGVIIPDQVAVAGFGDAPAAREAKLTTIDADVVQLGRCAARQLIHQMEGHAVRGVTTLRVLLRERETG